MTKIPLKFRRLANATDLALPSYATAGAAGMDIAAAINQPMDLEPRETMAIPTGFAIEIPPRYEIQIRPRSGLALKHGVTIANAPGTIDSDYRGEVAVILINLGQQDFIITPGMRIALMVIAPVTHCRFEDTLQLDMSDRGAGGFGSTGL